MAQHYISGKVGQDGKYDEIAQESTARSTSRHSGSPVSSTSASIPAASGSDAASPTQPSRPGARDRTLGAVKQAWNAAMGVLNLE